MLQSLKFLSWNSTHKAVSLSENIYHFMVYQCSMRLKSINSPLVHLLYDAKMWILLPSMRMQSFHSPKIQFTIFKIIYIVEKQATVNCSLKNYCRGPNIHLHKGAMISTFYCQLSSDTKPCACVTERNTLVNMVGHSPKCAWHALYIHSSTERIELLGHQSGSPTQLLLEVTFMAVGEPDYLNPLTGLGHHGFGKHLSAILRIGGTR